MSTIAKLVLLAGLSTTFAFSAELSTKDIKKTEQSTETAKLGLDSNSDVNSDSWNFLKPYVANYSFLLDDDKLGHSIRTFSCDKRQWELDTNTLAKKFIINLKSKENSKFHIKDGLLINDRFVSYSKRTFKKAKNTKQMFDWNSKLETGSRNKKKWEIPIESQVFDRVSHLIQLQADLLDGKTFFNYPVSHKGKIHDYLYRFAKTEVITTKMGNLEAQKYVRMKSNGATFIVWFSPELEYFPIKISQSKKDSPVVTLLLESIEYSKLPENMATDS